MSYDFIAPHPSGTLVFVWVVPNASRDEIVGRHDDMLKVKVAAPPEGGKANRKVAVLVAAAVGGKRGIVVDGQTGRRKAILIEGIAPAAAADALRSLLAV
jgi:hypothetical protein